MPTEKARGDNRKRYQELFKVLERKSVLCLKGVQCEHHDLYIILAAVVRQKSAVTK